MEEIWKDIINYQGFYQISTFGRVKSLARISLRKHHWSGTIIKYHEKEKIISVSKCKKGFIWRYG